MFDRLPLGIYWDKFWPLVDGCTPVDPTCDHCWRAREANFRSYGAKDLLSGPNWNCQIRPRPDKFDLPMKVKRPSVWFVLNDLYHEMVTSNFITHAYEVMEECPQHIFIVCTKRPERIVPVLYGEEGHFYMGGGDYLPNVWHMTTTGNQEMADKRIPELLKLGDASPGWPVLGVSIEPMLGPINIGKGLPPIGREKAWAIECGAQSALDWVVLGGETGPGARPMHPDWVRSVRDQCQAAGIPFLFKQWGEWIDDKQMIYGGGATMQYHVWESGDKSIRVGKKAAGRLLDGREWNELANLPRLLQTITTVRARQRR